MGDKQVSINGQLLHGRDRYGWWTVQKLTGWFESPEMKTLDEDRSNAHGSFTGPAYYSSRAVSIKGRLVAKSHSSALAARNLLAGLVGLPSDFIVVSDDGLLMQGKTSSGKVTPGDVVGRWFTFTIDLNFPDPFKYGKWRSFESSAGSAGLFHYGNTDAHPIVDVTGSAAGGYTLEKSGWKVTVTRPLLSGQTHSLDYRTGILRVNGAVARGALSFANFKPVRPGITQDLTITVPTGSASFVAGLHDTFI